MFLVAAYLRVSTEDQAQEGFSIPAQKERLTAYCTSQGWGVYDFYVDDGYSGKDLNRPHMQRMITDIKAKKFNAVLVYKLDRLSRRQKDVLYFIEDICEPFGVGFKSATEPFDTTTPFGKAAIGMMAVFAQLERETIIERSRMGKKEAAKQGKWSGGPVTYGYIYNGENLVIDETKAEIVRKIYRLYEGDDLGQRTIAIMLNDEGIPSPGGKKWSNEMIRYIVTNPTYAGLSQYKGNIFPGSHEEIIPHDQWKRVQKLVEVRYATHFRRPATKRLLSGIAYCGICGKKINSKTTHYFCSMQNGWQYPKGKPEEKCRLGFYKLEGIEKQVIEKLMRYSFDEKLIRETVLSAIQGEGSNVLQQENSLKQLQKQVADTQTKLNRWYDAFENGSLDVQSFTARITDLTNKKVEIEGKIKALELQMSKEKERTLDVESYIELIKNFPLLWENATFEEQQLLINQLVKKVTIYKGGTVEVEIV
ncbi:MAG TPA: recombinase family protein [Flavobacterium sp.]|nr:recombinase family protein [Flavobacterium sp.]